MYKEIELSQIKISTYNARKTFDSTKMAELTASIKEKGILVPLLVRPLAGAYELVSGERRLKAARSLGLKTAPVLIKNLTDTQAIECQVIENLQREDVHPLEEAEGYEQLLKQPGYKDVKDIAAKVGKSPTYIYGRLKLCELIPENRKLFYAGKFSPSVALLVARVPAQLQKEAGNKVVHGEWNRGPLQLREAQEYIHKHFMLQLKEAQFDTKEKGLAGKGSCAECLKRTGNQKELFADVSGADVCTDPGCFEAKKNAFTQRTIDALKKQNKTVVSQDEAKRLFKYENDESPENKYEALDESDYYGGRYRKLREIVKATKDAKIVYAVQPFSGKIIEMVEKTELPRILKKAGIKIRRDDELSGRSSKDLAKAKTENRVREAKRGFWIGKVSAARDRRCMNVIILSILLHDMGWSEAEEMAGDDWTIPKLYNRGDEDVQKLIAKIVAEKPKVLDDEDLEFLAGKLGFSMAKDYAITETYLKAMTKEQLNKLAVELGIATDVHIKSEGKKIEIVAAILKHAPKGKVPKELVK